MTAGASTAIRNNFSGWIAVASPTSTIAKPALPLVKQHEDKCGILPALLKPLNGLGTDCERSKLFNSQNTA